MYKKIIKRFRLILNVFLGKYFIYSIEQYNHHKVSFSQEGENIILNRIFETQKIGFYVDVGAHHPQRFSNTYFFYLKGWNGINIDPMPGSMGVFKKLRPRDINLEIAIADKNKSLMYFQFNEPALNSFSEEVAIEKDGLRDYKIINKQQIETFTLSQTLDKFLPSGQGVDFLTIDVEGLDLEVLGSNDWNKYKPYVVLVEDLNRFALENINESKVYGFMSKQGYELYAKTVNTLFFINYSSKQDI